MIYNRLIVFFLAFICIVHYILFLNYKFIGVWGYAPIKTAGVGCQPVPAALLSILLIVPIVAYLIRRLGHHRFHPPQ